MKVEIEVSELTALTARTLELEERCQMLVESNNRLLEENRAVRDWYDIKAYDMAGLVAAYRAKK